MTTDHMNTTTFDPVSHDWSGTPLFEGNEVALVDETGHPVTGRFGTVVSGDHRAGVWVVWDDALCREQVPGDRLLMLC